MEIANALGKWAFEREWAFGGGTPTTEGGRGD